MSEVFMRRHFVKKLRNSTIEADMTNDKRKCAHGWPEQLHPCPACTMDKSMFDAEDAFRAGKQRFAGLSSLASVPPLNTSWRCWPHMRTGCMECIAEMVHGFGFDPASGPDQTVEMNYQLNGEGVEVTSITDKPDPKNTRDDWFQLHGAVSCGSAAGEKLIHTLYGEPVSAELARVVRLKIDQDLAARIKVDRENNRLLGVIAERNREICVLRQACKSAGDEIRELHAQRKPERHGAYLLTFPECATSRGMYLAIGVLLAVVGGLLAWVLK